MQNIGKCSNCYLKLLIHYMHTNFRLEPNTSLIKYFVSKWCQWELPCSAKLGLKPMHRLKVLSSAGIAYHNCVFNFINYHEVFSSTMDPSQEECPCDWYHLSLAPAFDSSISFMVPITKMATEWDTFFLFQKWVKYNSMKLL